MQNVHEGVVRMMVECFTTLRMVFEAGSAVEVGSAVPVGFNRAYDLADSQGKAGLRSVLGSMILSLATAGVVVVADDCDCESCQVFHHETPGDLLRAMADELDSRVSDEMISDLRQSIEMGRMEQAIMAATGTELPPLS